MLMALHVLKCSVRAIVTVLAMKPSPPAVVVCVLLALMMMDAQAMKAKDTVIPTLANALLLHPLVVK